MVTLEKLVDKHYNQIFDKTLEMIGDDLYELVIEIKTYDGKTIRRSWIERNKMLEQPEHK